MTDSPEFDAWAKLPAGDAVDLARPDQDARWRAGVGLPAEEYLAALPAVAADPELALVLVYGEVLSRAARGESPDAAEYRRRFPRWADRIDLQFAVHAALHPSAGATRTFQPDDAPTGTFAPLDHAGLLATLTRGLSAPPPPSAPFRLPAGTVLAGRYRVVAPLGRGGMGEVYRADDLTLGQSVALKFLPEHVAKNPASLDRFRKEVAAARQVAHPHVCRVFDIGEAGGQVFLSMEFIPGDDLAGVLRKAGRLSSGLAIDLARQVAAGLQAVHEEGLIHRDLKPANVMVDGKGRARLTDFGLAATAESVVGVDAFSGTPAYQAPEQLTGGTVSERTDVYALGLLAYELLTGRRPFDATDRNALIEQQRTTKPAAPSSFDATTPPEVDRIVLKCLASDPKDRPASADEVRRTLPGDAALNAALAAGLTPTAEAVADAGGEGRLKRWVAVGLAAIVLLFALLVGLMQFTTQQQFQQTALPPAELRPRCERLLAQAGHPMDIRFTADGYEFNGVLTDWRDQYDRAMDRREDPTRRFARGVFFLRVSPTPIIPSMPVREQPMVTPIDPAFGTTGSAQVLIDTQGRLLQLKRLPPPKRAGESPSPPDWARWFEEAGFDLTRFQPVEPERAWTVPHDNRYAWQGVFPERPSIPVRIEAATEDGELVGFGRIAPWTPPEFDSFSSLEEDIRYQTWWLWLPLATLAVGGWLAYRNVRAGSADVQGAVRFAVAFGLLHLVMYLLYMSRLNLGGMAVTEWTQVLARVLLNCVRLAVAYLALEPFIRRRRPWQLIGWRRLLGGRVGDPRVGQDVLVGTAVGGLVAILFHLLQLLPGWLGRPPELPGGNIEIAAHPLHIFVPNVLAAVDQSLTVLFLTFVFGLVLRTAWLWVPATLALLILVLFGGQIGANRDILMWLAPLISIISLGVLLRQGLLALMAAWLMALVVTTFPILYGWGTWFWPASALAWAAVLSTVGYGLVVSVGGWRRLVRAETAG